jgi:hypothetical protein
LADSATSKVADALIGRVMDDDHLAIDHHSRSLVQSDLATTDAVGSVAMIEASVSSFLQLVQNVETPVRFHSAQPVRSQYFVRIASLQRREMLLEETAVNSHVMHAEMHAHNMRTQMVLQK